MARNPKIKLKILTEKQLDNIVYCECGNADKYRNMFFYVDESNISITNNAKGKCKKCAKK